jgi:hypothetical protein
MRLSRRLQAAETSRCSERSELCREGEMHPVLRGFFGAE